MRKVSTWAFLYRLRALLGIQDDGKAPDSSLLEDIQPVYDVNELLSDHEIIQADGMDLTITADTFVVAFTVPVDGRWQLKVAEVSAVAAVSAVSVRSGVGRTPVRLTTDATARSSFNFVGVYLEAGWQLGRTATGNVADGAEYMRCLVRKQKIGG